MREMEEVYAYLNFCCPQWWRCVPFSMVISMENGNMSVNGRTPALFERECGSLFRSCG